MFRAFTLALCLASTFILTACDDGSTPLPGADYLPIAVGDRWHYATSLETVAGVTPAEDAFVVISGEREVGGESVRVRDVSNPQTGEKLLQEFVRMTASGLELRFTAEAPLFGQQQDALTVLKLPLQVGDSWLAGDWQAAPTTSDGDGDGQPELADIRMTVTVSAIENIHVPAGYFNGTVKVSTLIQRELTMSANHSVVHVQTHVHEWYAYGVGLVKRETVYSYPDGTETLTSVLLRYAVNGVRSEYRPPAVTASTPSAGTIGSAWPDIRVQFDETLAPDTLEQLEFDLRDASGQHHTADAEFNELGELVFASQQPLPAGNYTAILRGVSDVIGNAISPQQWTFSVDRSIPGDPENYIPLEQGDRWHYRFNSINHNNLAENESSRKVQEVGAMEILGGFYSRRFSERTVDSDDDAMIYHLAKTDAGVYQLFDTADISGTVPEPRLTIRLPLRDNDRYKTRGERGLDAGSDVDGDGINETFDWFVLVNVERLGPTEFPSPHTSDDVFKVTTRHHQELHSSRTGLKHRITLRETVEILASGVGSLQTHTVTTTDTDHSERRYELLDFSVGGRRSDSIAPALTGWLNPAESYTSLPDGLTALFSELINGDAIDDTMLVLRDAHGVAFDGDVEVTNNLLRFRPPHALPDGSYTLTITGIPDFPGNTSGSDSRSFRIDNSPPRLLEMTPAQDATDASPYAPIILRFDEHLYPHQLDTDTDTITTLRNIAWPDMHLPLTRRIEKNELHLSSSLLAHGQTYELTLGTDVKDMLFNSYAASGAFRFTTRPHLFAEDTTHIVNADVESVAVGDVNADGRPDIVAVSSLPVVRLNENTLFIFTNVSTDTRNRQTGIPETLVTSTQTGCPPTSVALGDVTGDGQIDIVVGEGGCGLKIYQRDANGNWPQTERLVSADTNQLRIADIDNDGRADIVGVGRTTGAVSIWRQSANGGVTAAQTFVAVPYSRITELALGDVNGDGRHDIVVTNRGEQNPLAILYQSATGEFATPFYPLANTPWAGTDRVAIGDFNADGRNDIVVTQPRGSIGGVIVFRQRSDGHLASPESFDVASEPAGIVLADLDHNGLPDVILSSADDNKTYVYTQDANGQLTYTDRYTVQYTIANPSALTVGDVDNDGNADVIRGDRRNLSVLFGKAP